MKKLIIPVMVLGLLLFAAAGAYAAGENEKMALQAAKDWLALI